MKGKRISLNARILVRRVRDVSAHARTTLNLGLAFQDWRQAYRNRGNRNAIFIWVPKTAGYSVYRVFKEYGAQKLPHHSLIERYFENRGIVTFGHISVRHLREAGFISDEYWQSAWKFAFVRHPYARAVSLFRYLKRIHLLPETTSFRVFCAYLSDRAFEPVGLDNDAGLSMLNPQTAWLVNDEGELLPDYVSKVKDAAVGYRKIVSELHLAGAPSELPRENNRTRRVDREILRPGDARHRGGGLWFRFRDLRLRSEFHARLVIRQRSFLTRGQRFRPLVRLLHRAKPFELDCFKQSSSKRSKP